MPVRIVPFLLLAAGLSAGCGRGATRTVVSIEGEKFLINGTPTGAGREWEGVSIEGRLMNARMVQGIFDDANPATRDLWAYPDTGGWDPDRNTREFTAAMAEWYRHGLLAFTLNLQGGSPTGYGNRDWINTAYEADGTLRDDYAGRLKLILDRADELGMVVILGLFYFGQDQHLRDEAAVTAAVGNVLAWLFTHRYRNVLIEIDNECDVSAYDHAILKPERVHELIELVRRTERDGYRYPVGTSYGGGSIPGPEVLRVSDFVLLHGNGVDEPARIARMIAGTRERDGYRPMPVLFNEDDHCDFDQPVNNCTAAVRAGASWGYFDYRRQGEGFAEGFQSVPVDWSISSDRKRAFFTLLEEITGGGW